ncbi:MAG: acyl carrier protein [Lachnospiraceae bacterium]|nr:acyl carrier protein [Lachnospiraceae bacterium]
MELERLKEIIADKLNVSPEDVVPEASFVEDLEADSLDLLDVVMAIEDETGTTVPDEQLASLKTVGDAIELLKNL